MSLLAATQYTITDLNDGKSISKVTQYYRIHSASSGIVAGGTGWLTTPPVPTSTQKYLWSYTKTDYINPTDSSSTNAIVIGVYGDKGETGDTGATGRGITGTAIAYQASSSGTSTPTGTWSPTVPTVAANQYLWTRVTVSYSTGADTVYYSVGRMGKDGAKGDTGNTGNTGATGVGVSGAVVTYQSHTSGTIAPTGTWLSTPPVVAAEQYLWTRVITSYTSGDPTTQYSVGKMGKDGAKGDTGNTGATGRGIVSTTIHYQAGASGTSAPTGTWGTTVPTVAANQFLWTRITTTYSSGNPTEHFSVGRMGKDGDKGATGDTGAAGRGISGTAIAYAASTNGVNNPTTGWQTTIPAVAANSYLWTRVTTSYTSGADSIQYSVGKMGKDGAKGDTGAPGKAISAITEYFRVHTAATGITAGGTGWLTTVPTLTKTNKYLWNYTKTDYINPTDTSSTVAMVIGVYGDQGLPGAGGETGSPGRSLSNMTSYYRLHTASTGITVGSGSWDTTIPTLTATNKYLWQYIKSDYINPTSSSNSTPVVIGAYGDKGETGGVGPAGRSVVTIVDEYYLSTSASSATGGSWSITMPAWGPSRWIWTRQNITWSTAPTSTQTTAVLAGAINTAAETAHSANATAASAQSAAATASTNATNAVNKVNDITDDNKITPDEKQVLAKEWEIIKGEKPLNEAQATTFAITTEKTAYTNAYNALNTYLNITYPILTNLTTTTAIASGSAMRALYKTYYDAKTVLLNLIAVKAAAKAQSSAEEYARTTAKSLNFGYRYAENITIYGDSDKYYPVVIKGGDQDIKRDIIVKRGYSELAPPDWNTAAHKGGLTLKIKANFGGWGGANYSWEIHEFEEMYSTMFAGAQNVMSQMAFAIFLRGGGTTGARYHLYSDQSLTDGRYSGGTTGIPISPQICLNEDLIGETGTYTWYAPPYRTLSAANLEEIRIRNVIPLTKSADSAAKTALNNATTAITNAATAQTKAENAFTAANAANDMIADIASDSIVTPVEKSFIIEEWDIISTEFQDILDQAADIPTVNSGEYELAYDNLHTYLLSEEVGSEGLLVDTSVSTVLADPAVHRLKFKTYYTQRLKLLNGISNVTQTTADDAFDLALEAIDDSNRKNSVFHGTGEPPEPRNGDLWFGENNALKRWKASQTPDDPTPANRGTWVPADNILITETFPNFISEFRDSDGIYTTLSGSQSFIDEMGQKATVTSVNTLSTTVSGITGTIQTLQGSYSGKNIGQIAALEAAAAIAKMRIGAKNLVLASNKTFDLSADSLITEYLLSSAMDQGKEYTISLKGTLGTGRTSYVIKNVGGLETYVSLSATDFLEDENVYSKTFICPDIQVQDGFEVHQSPTGSSESTIDWIMIESGNVRTDWTISPEELSSQIESLEYNFSADQIWTKLSSQRGFLGVLDEKVSFEDYEEAIGDLVSVTETLTSDVKQLPGQFVIDLSKDYDLDTLNALMYGEDWKTSETRDGGLVALTKNINKNFTFDVEDGMIISSKNNTFSIVITEESISFNQDDESVASISGKLLHIPDIGVIETIVVGDLINQGQATLDVIDGGLRGSWTDKN